MQIIVFKLNDGFFAISTDRIDEITKFIDPTRIPNSPFGVEGIINLRGSVVAQVSLSKLLKMEEDKDYNNIVVINKDSYKVGLLINDVLRVMNIEEEDIQSIEMSSDSGVKGIIEIDEKIVSVLDLEHLLLDRFANIA